jgi:GNAT superfamily N-acetyltransferase
MIELRRATANDADAAAAVFTESRRDAGGAIPPSVHTPEDDRWFVREVLIGERETWIAIEGSQILGLLTLHADFIDQLYVASTVQGCGHGTRFVELAKKLRPDGLQLWAFASNRAAQAFYMKHGFVEVERTDGAGNEEKAPDIRYVWKPATWTSQGTRRP